MSLAQMERCVNHWRQTGPTAPTTASPPGAHPPVEATVLEFRRCPVCYEKPLTGNQQACSGKCRARWSRELRERDRPSRDRLISWHLRAALELLGLGPEGKDRGQWYLRHHPIRALAFIYHWGL